MRVYCKKFKKTQVTRFQKKLVLISMNKIKGKSRCDECSTKRSFIHKIEIKYDLESELEIYLQFLLANVIKQAC